MSASLAGVTLHVKDVEASLAFYRKIPGATIEVHRPGSFALLQIGGARLGLLRQNHGAFHVEIDTDDLDAMHAELVAAGIDAPKPSNKPWGQRDMLVIDPDGNMIEFG